MTDSLKKLSPVKVWLLSIATSVAATEIIVVGIEMLLNGAITYDFLLIGLVVSLIVAGLAGGFLIIFLNQQKRIEIGIGVASPALEQQESVELPVTDVKEIARDIAERKPVEEPTYAAREHADIRQAIQKLDVLPAMPVIAQRLLALNLDTEEGEHMLLALIGQDAQISAKILGLSNSAMIGASRHITTVREAAMLLGIGRVQSIATGIAILSLMAKPPACEFNIQDLWLHSFRIVFATQGIARAMPQSMRPSDDQIFLAGMLHDIGYLVLAYIDPKLSNRLHNYLAAQPERPAMDVEREILDVCHDELGAELARHWNLPDEVIAVLRYHHSPEAAGAAVGQPLVRMINIAERLLPTSGFAEYVIPEISAGEWAALGIDPSRADEVKEQVQLQVEQATQFFGAFS